MSGKRGGFKNKRCLEMAEHCMLQERKADLCSHYILIHPFIDNKPDIDISDFSLHTQEQAARVSDYINQRNKRIKESLEKLRRMTSKYEKSAIKKTSTTDYGINNDDDAEYEEYLEKTKQKAVGLGFNEDFKKIPDIDIKNEWSFPRVSGFYTKLGDYFRCKHVDDGLALKKIVEKDLCTHCLAAEKSRRILITGARKYEVDDLEKYKQLLDEKLMLMIGHWSNINSVVKAISDYSKQQSDKRTALSTATKRKKRSIKEKLIYEAYLKMLRDKTPKDKKLIAALTENKMAGQIKEEIIADLNTKGITSISERTIINILRKRDKSKFPWYPWEKI